jgi:hypothetical protein
MGSPVFVAQGVPRIAPVHSKPNRNSVSVSWYGSALGRYVATATSAGARMLQICLVEPGRGRAMGNDQAFRGHDGALGLNLDEVRALASRQLSASLVVAVVVLAAGALVALRASHEDSAGIAQRSFAAVQQPTFVMRQTQHVAGLVRHGFELP